MIPDLSPYIRIAWYSTLDPYTVIRERVIYDYELLYLKEGTAEITVSGQQYDAVPGDVFLFRPGQVHQIRCLHDAPVIQPHVHFDLQYYPDRESVRISYKMPDKMSDTEKGWLRRDVIDEIYPNIPPRIHLHSTQAFEQYLFELINEYNTPCFHTQVRQQWLFLRLFDLYLSEVTYTLHTQAPSHAESLAVRIKSYLDNNKSSPLHLDKLAETLYLDKSYVIRVFRQVYHETPLSYHQRIRVQKAREMLLYTNLSITEIAESTGFSSIHDFDRVFKKVDGANPGIYRSKLPPAQKGGASDSTSA